ncbi:YdeI family protein [Demequina sp. NBRC 110051]|uniref:YdeI/OmpD-associated family protein n=1 Tax=Demequina sp. NBRC 110051 TaxID=1570340 RepID=UPI000A05ED84|nr:YdeI/OmpD-associated family protein [Demequina sp. NBRC 110051]
MPTTPESDRLTVEDQAAWRAWLDAYDDTSTGVWLTLTKKAGSPVTTLTYAQALDEALCSGWIDGRRRANDERTFLQHFTPRRARSVWSQRNVTHVARLIDEGRMRPRGHAEITKAQADGRWERAYEGQATATVPDDLAAALTNAPTASAAWEALTKAERFPHLAKIQTADATARAAYIARLVARLGG